MYKEYTLRTHLHNLCLENPQYKELENILLIEEKELKKILSLIIFNYPHYSLHDDSHSETIINNIELFLGEENIKKLQPTETFLIIMSAFYHDIGMNISHKSIEKELLNENFENFLKEEIKNEIDIEMLRIKNNILKIIEALKTEEKILDFEINNLLKIRKYLTIIFSEYFRKKHAKMSGEFIEKERIEGLNLTRILKPRINKLLSLIVELHQKNFESILKELPKQSNGILKDIIHPRFIACLLRIGDLLDLDNGRFIKYIEKIFGDLPESSKIHYHKHEAITNFFISPYIIEVEADCENDEVYFSIREWLKWLEEEIRNISFSWNEIMPKNFEIIIPSLKIENLKINGKKYKSENVDLKLNFNINRIYDLFHGEGIYNNKFIFVRELIQNSIDASKIKLWMNIKNEYSNYYYEKKLSIEEIKSSPTYLDEKILKDYNLEIRIYTEDLKDNNFFINIEVRDKGIGIKESDLRKIQNIFENHRKDINENIIKDMPYYLKPTRAFGLGLQSCFLVTDKIFIYTKSCNEESKEIKMITGKKNGFISVTNTDEIEQSGTKVVIKIHKEKLDEIYKYNSKKRIENIKLYYLCLVFQEVYKEMYGKKYFDKDIIEKDKTIEKLYWNLYGFNLKITCDELNYIQNEDEKYKIITFNNNVNHKINLKYEYFIENNKIIILDKINKMWVEIEFTNKVYGKVEVYFKDIKVSNEKNKMDDLIKSRIYSIPFCNVRVNFFEENSEDVLTISRKEIKEEIIETLKARFNKFKERILVSIFEELFEIKNKNIPDSLEDIEFVSTYIYQIIKKNSNNILKLRNRKETNLKIKEKLYLNFIYNGEKSSIPDIIFNRNNKIKLFVSLSEINYNEEEVIRDSKENGTILFTKEPVENYFLEIYEKRTIHKKYDYSYQYSDEKSKININKLLKQLKKDISIEDNSWIYWNRYYFIINSEIEKYDELIYNKKLLIPFYFIGKNIRNDNEIIEEIKKLKDKKEEMENFILKNIDIYINKNLVEALIKEKKFLVEEVYELYSKFIADIYLTEVDKE